MAQDDNAKLEAAKKANSLHNLTEINFDTVDDVQGIARDLLNENLFNPDDSVVLKNIFDGESTVNGFEMPRLPYKFSYNGITYRVEPGQTVRIPGSSAYIFVKHLVSLIYRRLEGKDEMDKRTYPLTDKWVSKIVVRVDATLAPDEVDRQIEHALPDYEDERIAAAANSTGGGEVSLGAQLDDADITDEQFDKTPDFDARTNPNVQFKDGEVVDTREPATTVNARKGDEVAFPDAKTTKSDDKATKSASRQAKK